MRRHCGSAFDDCTRGALSGSVSRFAVGSALFVLVLYLALLFGVSVGRPVMAAHFGPLAVGNWLILALHLAPVLLGVAHLRRRRHS